MSANISINLTGDNADAIRAFQQVIVEENKLARGLEKIAQENRKSAAESKKLEDAAKRVWQETRGPIERYNAEVARLDRLMGKTTMTQQTYNRAVAKAREELHAAGKAGEDAFGDSAIEKIGAMALGFVSVGTAVGKVTEALNEMEKARADAAQKAIQSRGGLGSLAQVSSSPEEFKALEDAARETFRLGGASSVEEAAGIVFQLQSSGQMKYLKMFQDLRSTGLVNDPTTLAESAGSLLAAMGKTETGNIRDIINKGMSAAGPGTGTVEQILRASAEAGVGAPALGLHDEEVMSGVAILSKTFGPEKAGTRLNALLTMMDKKNEFKGLGLEQSLLNIQKKNLSGKDETEYFGTQESLQAYRNLVMNLPDYKSALALTENAQQQDVIGAKLKYHEIDPSLKAARSAVMADAREELSREVLGTKYNLVNTTLENTIASHREGGGSETMGMLMRAGAGMARRPFGDQGYANIVNTAAQFIRWPMGINISDDQGLGVFNPAMAPPADRRREPLDEVTKKLDVVVDKFGKAVDNLDRTSKDKNNPATNHRDRQ